MSRYSIIYADPPWGYKNSPSKRGTTRVFAKNHYDLMSTEDLKRLPIRKISDNNSVCLMWATFPMMKDALDVMESWGFKYRTVAFLWVKRNKKADTPFWGGGYYTRANAEVVLLGVKGRPLPRLTRSIHQLISEPVSRHSEKPDVVRKRIVELFGDLPRIELFARNVSPGWHVWGNEVTSDISIGDEL